VKTIWKFEFAGDFGPFPLNMPEGAEILSVQVQRNGRPCLWALIPDQDAAPKIRTFWLFGTGWSIGIEHLQYIGTFQFYSYICHLFEEG